MLRVPSDCLVTPPGELVMSRLDAIIDLCLEAHSNAVPHPESYHTGVVLVSQRPDGDIRYHTASSYRNRQTNERMCGEPQAIAKFDREEPEGSTWLAWAVASKPRPERCSFCGEFGFRPPCVESCQGIIQAHRCFRLNLPLILIDPFTFRKEKPNGLMIIGCSAAFGYGKPGQH